jgi:hypothetical protein
MADAGETIGLTGVFDNTQFHAGIVQYNADIDAAARKTEQGGQGMEAVWNDATQRFHDIHTKRMVAFGDVLKANVPAGATAAAGATKEFGAQSSILTGVIAGLVAGGTTKLIDGLAGVANSFGQAKDRMVDFIVEATQGAAREAELGLAAQYMGQQAGYTAKEVADLQSGLEQAGATGDAAGEAMAKLSMHHLDAARAVDLFQLAQGASIITGQGVQSTYLELIDSIGTLRTRSLKQIGITVDQTQANIAYAASIGKDKDALTEDEQAQALMNATLAQGSGLMGLYAEGIKLPAAQLRRLSGSLLPELMDAVGAPFQQAFGSVVGALANLVTWLTAALREGGALYPVMVQLGTAASLVGDALTGLSKIATDAGDALFGSFGGKMQGTASAAVTWGLNIVTNLANGILQGAADALIGAMNFVGDLLSEWLSPGSPPKVAPEIDQWGAAAIGEWLHGFTTADFSALDAIQGPLQSALGAAFGASSKNAASEAFKHLSGEILDSLSAGQMSSQLFKEITATAGPYGQQIALLVQDQVALTAATRDAKAAQDALTAAQLASSTAGAKVSAGIREYNQMLRAGASQEDLAAKLASIKAAEKEKTLADQQVVTAKATADQTAGKVDALKEMVALQAAIVAQQQKLTAMASEAATKEPKPEKAAAGAKVPSLAGAGGGALPTPDLSGFGKGLSDAIDKQKAAAVAKFQELWARVAETAAGLWEKIKVYFQPAIDNIQGSLVEMQKFWEQHKGEIDIITQTIGVIIQQNLTRAFMLASAIARGALIEVSGIFKAGWQIANGDWAGALETLRVNTDLAMSGIVQLTGHSLEQVRASWQFNLESLLFLVGMKEHQIADSVTKWAVQMLNKFTQLVSDIAAAFDPAKWISVGQAIMDGIGSGIKSKMDQVAGQAIDAARKIIENIKRELGIHSPSAVFQAIGANTMQAMGAGIDRGASVPAQAMTSALARTVYPAAMLPIATGATHNVSMNMGGVNLYNQLDAQMLESLLTRVMKKAL